MYHLSFIVNVSSSDIFKLLAEEYNDVTMSILCILLYKYIPYMSLNKHVAHISM